VGLEDHGWVIGGLAPCSLRTRSRRPTSAHTTPFRPFSAHRPYAERTSQNPLGAEFAERPFYGFG
jgi:hypothetical protein